MPTPLIRKLGCQFLLSETDTSALHQVSTNARLIAAQEDLISEGDCPDGIHVIQSGFACRYKILPDGGRSITAFLIPGDICDLHVPIVGAMDHSIGTLSTCSVINIPRKIMDDLRANHPVINRALQWAGLVDEAILREWLVGMGRRPADKRIAHILCEVLLRIQVVGLATDDSYSLPITQVDLGDAAGLSNVHVNRVLQHLRGEGLIGLRSRSLNIPDFERLREFAEFNPNYLHLEPNQDRRWQGENGNDIVPPL